MTLRPDERALLASIVGRAVGLQPSERAAYVAQACRDNPELHQEVQSLLDAHDRAGSFLDVTTAGPSGPGDEAPVDQVGRRIGSYTIKAAIGRGGMGEVYLAHDSKLDRDVAIKILSRAVTADVDRVRRFHTEARAASSLNHPHILVVHDVGELDRQVFMVTEYVEGETLRARLERGPLALHETIALAGQIASALLAAHARGIVHRDVKPENVMIRPDGYVKLLDFGLAKLIAPVERASVDTEDRTIPGMVLGTPRYMSPEQARGAETDARTDVWSFGVMVYEMLAGRPPFTGATVADLLSAILSSEPVPLALQAPHTPPAVARIVMRALSKSRLERHADAAELSVELAALRLDTRGDERSLSDSPALFAGRAPSHLTPPGHVKQRTRLIVIPFRLLRPDADIEFLTFSLADSIATTLSNIDSLIVRSSLTAASYSSGALDIGALARSAEVDAVLTGTLMRAGSSLRVSAQLLAAPRGTIMWSERMDVPLDDVIRIQDDLSERIVDSLAVPLTAGEHDKLRRDAPASVKAYDLYLRATSDSLDPQHWARARARFIECVAEDSRYAPAWARLGRCYRLTSKFLSETAEEAAGNLKLAEVAFQKAFAINPDLPLAHHLYTVLETDLGRAEAAMLRLVARARQRRADPELYAGLVHACRYAGLLDASVAAHGRAKQLDPQISTSVAQTFWMQGQYERAIDGFATGFFVGLPLVALGRNDEALAQARASSALVRDPTTRIYQSIVISMLEGRREECLRLLRDLAPRNPDPESVYFGALTLAHLGDLNTALEQFERAVDMGFFCAPSLERDRWLDPLRTDSRFISALARARARCDQAQLRFRDAGGERLLGLT